MKNVFKSILVIIHLQLIVNFFTFLFLQLGLKVFVFHSQTYINTALFSLILMVVYSSLFFIVSLIKPKVLAYPFKARILLIFLMGIYTISFILAQQNFTQWRIYFLVHLPVSYWVRSYLPSEFDFTQQFLIGLFALTPSLGVKFAYEFSNWLQFKPKKKTH